MVYQKLHNFTGEDPIPSRHRLAHNPTAFIMVMIIDWVKRNI